MKMKQQPQLPIGYWLKQTDNAITAYANKVQQANGVSRAEWQVLNLLNDAGSASRDHIFEIMQTFVDAAGLDAIIARLDTLGWIEQLHAEDQRPAEFQLTAEGRQHHGTILVTQKEAREQTMQGISEADYATVIRVLQQIVHNLTEPAADAGPPAR
jgi:DNA-binding MarR family transcriptional regulator